ncbi:MAG: family hydrolase, diadenosine tetraphosphate hydrolase [Verrucomicrobiales bacterium]|nr:family hydrolase, diadenosine tetraphosphate hydrolase [Verrucomicrobiales bacterium]
MVQCPSMSDSHPRPATFTLHPRLAAGSHWLGRRQDCRLLLKDNALFPWILIVPEVPEGVEDLHQLDPDRFRQVMELVRRVSEFVSAQFRPDKLNVACIGNQVRQMHIHIVGRREGDSAWPGTVWAFEAKSPWPLEEMERIRAAARAELELDTESAWSDAAKGAGPAGASELFR